MKHLHLTLGFLRDQRARIDTSIELLEALAGAGGNGNGAASGNGHRGALKAAAEALALHEAQQEAPPEKPWPGRRPSPAKTKRRRAPVMRPLPEVAVPDGLELRGLPLREAIAVALRAYRKPLPTRGLAALLLGAGFEWDKAQPLTTAIGTWCGAYGRREAGIKGDAAGWRLR